MAVVSQESLGQSSRRRSLASDINFTARCYSRLATPTSASELLKQPFNGYPLTSKSLPLDTSR